MIHMNVYLNHKNGLDWQIFVLTSEKSHHLFQDNLQL